ncbi:MAG: hypothetical protein HFJ86_00890 [Oscillospiraceae bacterium]|nr:hypothetical protein [Oscillospiraceae bacterium]
MMPTEESREWGGRVGWVVVYSLLFEAARLSLGCFARCDERPKALPLEKSSLRLDL